MKLPTVSTAGNVKLSRYSVTSGASRNSLFFKSNLTMQLKHKKLTGCFKWNAGRSKSGHVVVWTKSKRTFKTRQASLNYKFRLACIGFLGGFLLKPKNNKLVSLLFLSTGSVTYVPSTTKHQLFTLTRFKSCFFRNTKRI